jgi:hypothetical protein
MKTIILIFELFAGIAGLMTIGYLIDKIFRIYDRFNPQKNDNA